MIKVGWLQWSLSCQNCSSPAHQGFELLASANVPPPSCPKPSSSRNSRVLERTSSHSGVQDVVHVGLSFIWDRRILLGPSTTSAEPHVSTLNPSRSPAARAAFITMRFISTSHNNVEMCGAVCATCSAADAGPQKC